MAWDVEGTKRRLLESASLEFSAHGLAGARVDRIAQGAGVNKERIYQYFGSKQELFAAVLTSVLARAADSATIDGTGVEAVGAYAGRLFDHHVQHPELARLAFWEGLEAGVPVAEEVRWVRQSAIAWSPDSKGFYYSGGNPPPPGATNSGGGLVFYHTLGQPRADDRRVLWSDRAGMTHYAEISDDGRWLVINGSLRADGKSEINLIDLAEPKPAPFKAMRRLSERWQFAGSDGAVLYFVTDYGAERGRLVAMDTGQSSLPITEVVPQAAERLQAARLKDGKMSLSYAGASGPVIRTVDQASLARR